MFGPNEPHLRAGQNIQAVLYSLLDFLTAESFSKKIHHVDKIDTTCTFNQIP